MLVKTVLLIGAGRMGSAMFRGWKQQLNSNYRIVVIDRHASRSAMDIPNIDKHGPCVEVFNSIADLLPDMRAEVIVLAVKPVALFSVIQELNTVIKTESLLVSVAAGVSVKMVRSYSSLELPIIRVMPNVGALVCRSATAAFASSEVTSDQRDVCTELFTALGNLTWLGSEADMHIATALSGSGPAYVFALCEAMVNSAASQGLTPDVSQSLAINTIIAVGRLLEDNPNPAVLRESVASPNGTTASGLAVLQHDGSLQRLIDATLLAAKARSIEIEKNPE